MCKRSHACPVSKSLSRVSAPFPLIAAQEIRLTPGDVSSLFSDGNSPLRDWGKGGDEATPATGHFSSKPQKVRLLPLASISCVSLSESWAALVLGTFSPSGLEFQSSPTHRNGFLFPHGVRYHSCHHRVLKCLVV